MHCDSCKKDICLSCTNIAQRIKIKRVAPRVQHPKGHSRGHRAPPKIQRDCGTVRSKKMLHKAQRRQRARRRQQHPHTSQGQREARTAAGGHHPKLSHGLRAQRSGTSGGNELASLLCVHQNYGNINCACRTRSPIPISVSGKRCSKGPRSKSARGDKNRSQLHRPHMRQDTFQGSDQGNDQERVYMIRDTIPSDTRARNSDPTSSPVEAGMPGNESRDTVMARVAVR